MSAHRLAEYDEAAKMYANGMSTAKVAAEFGVSPQSMYMSLKRRGVEFRKSKRNWPEKG